MDVYRLVEKFVFENVGENVKGVTIEPSRNLKHGDVATNAPIILAKTCGVSVQKAGSVLAEKVLTLPEVAKAEIAGVGFLNVTIKNSVWQGIVKEINKAGKSYGALNLGKERTIHIESVSANPTGPLHIGHARAAVFFSSLGKVLEKVGYRVVREYYINDTGTQIEALIDSAYARYKEILGYDFEEVPYPGEYMKLIGKQLAEQHGNNLLKNGKAEREVIRFYAINSIMESIKEDLGIIGVKHDIFVSERSLHSKIQEAIAILEKKGLIYKGELQDPKGKKKEGWKVREQLLFRSTSFGDTSDRSLQKEDGSWTYFAADLAYHLDKIERGFDNMVLGLGLDHAGYVDRLKSAVEQLNDKVKINIKLYNIVNLFENGAMIKMSKRSGKFLTLRELVNEVGSDVVKYMMLTRRQDNVLDLELSQVKEQSNRNPVFYVQYAHARACSILRQMGGVVLMDDNVDLSLLSASRELLLIKILAKWPRVLLGVANTFEVQRITNFLYEVAEGFHSLWHCGNKESVFRFIVHDDKKLTCARRELVLAVKNLIALGLDLLSIKAKESM